MKGKEGLFKHVTALIAFAFAGGLPAITYADISGSVFRDLPVSDSVPSTLNVSGVKEPNEIDFAGTQLGVPGITVSALDQSGATATTTTASDGTWTLTGLTGEVRVEFTGMPSYLQSSFNGADSNTSVQFVTDGATDVDFGLSNPANYFDNINPEFVTTAFRVGDPLLGDPANSADTASVTAVYLFNDDDAGVYDDTTNTNLANMREVGTTWGMAYQKTTETVFVSASIRRHAGLGSLGTGGIYTVDKAASSTAPWLDINTLAGVNTGANPRVGGADNTLPQTIASPSIDLNAFDAVGKVAIGDIDISEDGETLYAMDLGSRQLVSIDIDSKALVGTPIAIPTAGLPTTAGTCQADDVRPWAVKVYDGEVYVGVVCSAENSRNTDDLHAYMMQLVGTSFVTVLEYPLNFARSDSGGGGLATWEPWARNWADVNSPAGWATRIFSPIFSDIEFDIDGSVIMGFMDRGGHQIGAFTHQAISGDASVTLEGLGQGDILRACPNVPNVLGVWTLESNGSCGGITTAGAGNTSGPGGGEYYVGDQGRGPTGGGTHGESAAGALALVPGSGRIASTLMDPLVFADGSFSDVARNHGINWLLNSDGSDDQGYVIVPFTPNGNSNGTFSKSNAMGDLEVLGALAPLQIGNRVWEDTNNNGIQDPGEPGLNGVDVTVTFPGGLTATTTTATVNGVDGVYLFTDGDLTGGENIPRNTAGTISVPTSTILMDGSTGEITLQGTGTASTDSNPDPATGSFPITTGSDGENDHTFDIGYSAFVSIGSTVWADTDNSGDQNGAEAGIPGVTVNLYAADGTTLVATTTTDANGDYFFGGLPAGDYVVGVTPPAALPLSSTDIATSGADNQTDGDDNGIQANSGDEAKSPVISLVAGNEPLGEAAQGGDQDPIDANGDMTVDFGFVAPAAFVSIGSTVWADTDNSGTQNGAEAGIPGVTVNLYAADGTTLVATTTTDGNGDYFFGGLPAGDYVVGVIPPAATPLSSTDIATSGADNQTDGDDNGIQANSGDEAKSPVISLVAGNEPLGEPAQGGDQDPIDANGDMTVDFGFVPLVKIGNLIWIEDDNDGDPSTGTITYPPAGTVVTATGSDGTVYTGTTDATGSYSIDVPPNDTYVVTVGTPTDTVPTLGSSDNSVPDTTSEDNKTHDGIGGTTVVVGTEDNPTLDFGFVPAVKIGSRVWIETDGDGDASNGSPTPVAGATVTATSNTTGLTYTAVTDAAGNYGIDVPINDTYTVTITPPAGHTPTNPLGGGSIPLNNMSSDDQSHDASGTTVVVGTTDNLSVDFGFVVGEPTEIPVSPRWALLMLMLGLILFSFRSGSMRRS